MACGLHRFLGMAASKNTQNKRTAGRDPNEKRAEDTHQDKPGDARPEAESGPETASYEDRERERIDNGEPTERSGAV
jgi:hypothetical protein